MTTTIESSAQPTTLTLYNADRTPLSLNNPQLNLEHQEETITRCRLTFQVDWETYRQIEQDCLFNLKTGVKGSLSQGKFVSDRPLQLTTELKSALLSQLTEFGTTEAAIIDYLINLEPPADPLPANSPLITDNWYCLSVTQLQDESEVSYQTLWHHANPTTINQAASSTGEAIQGVMTFLQAAIASCQEDPKIKAANQELEQEFSNFFQQLGELKLEDTDSSQQPISEVMLDFFHHDDWDYYWWEEGETLQLECQVSNGRLTCYARAINDKQQFVFYSLCPLTAPENRRGAIAEFITKVNYGMVIGNFEFDYTDGEIRYKTSIDVEGDRLSPALIKQAVYLNVLTLDRYLPSLVAVINHELDVDQAIKLVEG